MSEKLLADASVYELENEIQRRKRQLAEREVENQREQFYQGFLKRPQDSLLGRCYVGGQTSTYNRAAFEVKVQAPGDPERELAKVTMAASEHGIKAFQDVLAHRWYRHSPFAKGLAMVLQHVAQAYLDALLEDPVPLAYASARIIHDYSEGTYGRPVDPRVLEELMPAAVENLAARYTKQELGHACRVFKLSEATVPWVARTAKDILKQAKELSTRTERKALKTLPDEVLRRFIATSSTDGWRNLIEPLTEALGFMESVEVPEEGQSA